jgi:putative acetyltransferase
MQVRPFKPSDTETVIELFNQTVHTIGARYYSPEEIAAWAPEITPETVLRWQTKLESSNTFIAEKDGIIIGFGDITSAGHLDHLYVHKDHQGSGASLALLKALETRARELGLTKITTDASTMAMPLARRRGFVVVTKQTIVCAGVELTNYAMKKNLT